MNPPWILVPLGNPGPEYAATRHNLGRLLLQRWLAHRGLRPEAVRFFQTGTLYTLTPELQALVPATYMNLSGQVCGEALEAGLSLDRLVVLMDDKDLPLGRGRFRLTGRANGHNGMASIMEHLQTEAVARLRLGIGPFQRPLHTFVLGEWTPGEQTLLESLDGPFSGFLERLAAAQDLTLLPGQLAEEAS